MKNLALLMVSALCILGCKKVSETEAREELKEAKQELKETRISESHAVKAKTAAEWQLFKTESGNDLASMESDLMKLNATLGGQNTKEKQTFRENYNKTKDDIQSLKGDLKRKDEAFESDMKNFGNKADEENKIFRSNFKNELDKVYESLKKMKVDEEK